MSVFGFLARRARLRRAAREAGAEALRRAYGGDVPAGQRRRARRTAASYGEWLERRRRQDAMRPDGDPQPEPQPAARLVLGDTQVDFRIAEMEQDWDRPAGPETDSDGFPFRAEGDR